jgi:hypothetical protein
MLGSHIQPYEIKFQEKGPFCSTAAYRSTEWRKVFISEAAILSFQADDTRSLDIN